MSRTLTISDDLYEWLKEEAEHRQLKDIERVLEQIRHEERVRRRQEAARRMDEHRERLFAKYGKMPDSVGSIREDRER